MSVRLHIKETLSQKKSISFFLPEYRLTVKNIKKF